MIERRQEAVEGVIDVSAEIVGNDLYKIIIHTRNVSPMECSGADRDAALMQSLVSTHLILGVRKGEFVSLLEPPKELKHIVAQCRNAGAWPVLVGDAGERDTMLASPIILYDYPQIAPESAGDLFDGTEIDEILSLRILTLTDEEKREIRQSDDRARADSGAHRIDARGAVHETARRGARSAPTQGGRSMNEWEWQLLEDKTTVERLSDRRRGSSGGRPRAIASAARRRRPGYRARRADRDHRKHRAGLRGQESRLRGAG